MKRKRESITSKTDLLYFLQTTEDASLKRSLNDQEIVNEMIGVVLGTSAVASIIGRGLYLLGLHPETTRRIGQCLPQAFDDNVSDQDLLWQNHFLDAVIKEITRLYLPFWSPVRYARDGIEIDGYQFPKKSIMIAVRFFSQRHPDYWNNPLAFDPDRFIKENSYSTRTQASNLLPFGAGPRACLGIHLAPLICRSVFARIVHRYRFELIESRPNPESRIVFNYGLYPENKSFMRFQLK